ncbi:hypothetical protein [Bradyrhizobium sp. CCBAU 21362]|uniref:hypothetical protein n=1 Tax=Bradyrhizobium sp. CCBAU 21362 TaxID=1325082 RepID=UPI0023064B84|nr:hypothetical protein [Bradyrhizobium sp. CCBAU 21362]
MDLGQPLEASRDRRGRPAPRRPFLFQLRPHFVLEERIGIEEIGAEQLLTSGVAREDSRHVVSAGVDRSGITCGTDRAPLRSLAYGLALLSDQNTFAISANIPINQLSSLISCAGDENGTVRDFTLSRSDRRARIDIEDAQLVLHPTPFRSRRTNRSRENQRESIPNDR